jgi:hypothetical protein
VRRSLETLQRLDLRNGIVRRVHQWFFAVTSHPEYFFPWVPEFPAKAELLEVSGRLHFHHFHSRGKVNYFTITSEHRRIDEVKLKCQAGFYGFSTFSCSDYGISKNLNWSKAVARYHPRWGMIELVVDGFPVPGYNYEDHKSFVERGGRQAGYRVLVSSLIIIFYFMRDYRLYRRRRTEYAAAVKTR